MITLSVLLSDLEDPHFRTEHFYLQMPLVSHTAPWPRTMSGLVRAILIVRLLRCTGSNRSMIKALRTIWNAAVILQFVWKMCVCVCVCLCVCLRGEQHWRLCRWERRDMQRKRDTENGREKEREGARERGRARKIQGAPVYHVAQSHSYTTSQLHKKKRNESLIQRPCCTKTPSHNIGPPYRTTPKRRLSSWPELLILTII